MKKINLHHIICSALLLILNLIPVYLSSNTTIFRSKTKSAIIKPELGFEIKETLDSLKLNFETIIEEIFNKKKEEFSKIVLHNEHIKKSGSNTSGAYIFDFNFNDEIKDYFLYYLKRPNVQPEITYDYKNKNDIEELNLEVNNWISQDHKPDIYFVCVTVEEALLWLNALDGKNLSYSNTMVDYLDLNLKKENHQIVSDVLKRHMNDFDSFVNTFLTQHSTNPEGTFLYSWFSYNKIYKDKEALKDKSKFQNFYRLFYKQHPSSTTDFRPKLTCINSQVGTYTDNLLINYFNGYFAAIKKVVDGEYLCPSLDSFYVKLNPNFLVPIPLDSMREEIGLLADKFARRLETAYVDRPSPFENYKSGKRYHYVDVDDILQSNLKDEIFDDQLAYLKEKSGFSFFIISGKSNFFMHPDLWNGFANLVKEKVNRDIVNTNGLILVTVPYRDVNIVLNEFSKQMPGVSFDPSTVDAEKLGAVFPSLQFTSEVFKNTFKYCRKNVDIYKGFLCADGSRYFEKKQFDLDEGVGLEFNSTILLLKNIYYEEIENLPKPERIFFTYKGKIKEENENPLYESQLASYKINVAALLHQSQLSYNDATSWEEVKNSKNIVEANMEEVMKDYLLNHAYIGSFASFFNDIGLLISREETPEEISDEDLLAYTNSGIKLEPQHTYDNELIGVLDKVIYATIDAVGLIPLVGDFSDLIGVGYAAVRGNEEQLGLYTLGAAIVGGSTIYIKGARSLYICAKGRKYIKEGEELYEITDALLAKKMAVAEQLGVSWNKVDEIGENLVEGLENGTYHSNQITNFHLLDEADHQELLRSLEAEGSDIFQLLRGKEFTNLELLADLTTNQQSRSLLSETLSELSETSLILLEKDLAGEAGDALKVYFRGSSGGLKAWEVAVKHNDAVRLDIGFLNKLDGHLATHPNLKVDLDDTDLFAAYKKVDADHTQGYEILDDLDQEIRDILVQKAANAAEPSWWKWIVRGRKFEKETVLPLLKDRTSDAYSQLKNKVQKEFGGNLDEYDMYTQVQFRYDPSDPSKYFVADQVYVKWGENANGQIIAQDIVVVENKLQEATKLTTHQNGGKAAGGLSVRSVNIQKAEGNLNPTNRALPQNTPISINNKWIKIFDSETGEVISDMKKI